VRIAYAPHDSATPLPRIPRLGLRVRWRATREARLARLTYRRKVANSVEHAVARAEQPYAPLSAAVPVNRPAVHEAQEALLELAERLRTEWPVDPAGVRMVSDLLRDGCGPLYAPAAVDDLRAAAERALRALDGRGDDD
jgi:hypothetical protein